MWYAFEAYNAETRYGWTQDEDVVNAIVAKLNTGREINLFSASDINEDEASALRLFDRNDLICTDDTAVDDVEAA